MQCEIMLFSIIDICFRIPFPDSGPCFSAAATTARDQESGNVFRTSVESKQMGQCNV